MKQTANELLADILRLTASETEDMSFTRELDELLETVRARHVLAMSTAGYLAEGKP